MRELEGPVAGGCPGGSNSAGSRRAPASLRELFTRAERASSTQGAIGRTAALDGSSSGAVAGFPGASPGRGGGRQREEARAAVAGMGPRPGGGGEPRGAPHGRGGGPEDKPKRNLGHQLRARRH